MQTSAATIRLNKIRGALVSIFIHGILALIIIYFGYTTPLPLPEEEGIAINFGTTETGEGLEEPSPAEDIASTETSVSQETAPEDILTQEAEEAPVLESKPNKIIDTKVKETVTTEKVTTTTEVKKTEERKVNERALFPGVGSNSSTSQSQGFTSGQGNQGQENGVANATNYTGNSSGNGISYRLDGRKFVALPKPEYSKQTYGTVVVEITVDREGKVVAAMPGIKGSTTLDEYLLSSAKKAALGSRFDPNPGAPAFQKGVITYHFLLN